MSDATRDAFLERVRQAVRAGNRPGSAPPLPERGNLGYQGAGPGPVARFRQEWEAAGGRLHVVADAPAASAAVLEILGAVSARRVLLGGGAVLETLSLSGPLAALGVEVVRVAGLGPADRGEFFTADVGISGVAALIAETGSLVVESATGEPRSLSLLPPVHIAVANREQLLADLFDLFEARRPAPAALPSALTLITGPSKTGDIELRLVTGVHGPGVVHVVLIAP
jgi:L-lactate dehydrogenase complex protein LldG